MKPTQPKLKDIAAKIDAHLKRMEADPAINRPEVVGRRSPFYRSAACVRGTYVKVTYFDHIESEMLDRGEALRYLAWLDAGNNGKHFDAGIRPGERRAQVAADRARAREAARVAAEEKRAAAVVFEPVTADEARSFVETYRAGSDVWRLARTVLALTGETQ